MTATTATEPKLSLAQARRLHDAEVAYDKLARGLEDAKQTRDELRSSYLPRIPLSDDPDEAAAGTRVVAIGGITARVTPVAGRESFSLKDYRQAGHKLTAAMRSCITHGRPSQRWTVTGPAKRHDAVEPAR